MQIFMSYWTFLKGMVRRWRSSQTLINQLVFDQRESSLLKLN